MEKLEAASVFFSVFLTLAFVLFLAWFFLRWMGKRAPMQSGSRHIKILDRVIIDREKYLLLISTGDKMLLVAMSSGAIETLCEFDKEQQTRFDTFNEGEQSFAAVIRQMLPKTQSSADKGVDHT